MKNVNGDEEFVTATGINGVIAEQYVLRYHATPDPAMTVPQYQRQIPDFFFDYGPFTLTVTAPGFDEYVHIADIDEAVDWSISLQASGQVQAQGIDAMIEDNIQAEV